jgi:hypothetical protein
MLLSRRPFQSLPPDPAKVFPPTVPAKTCPRSSPPKLAPTIPAKAKNWYISCSMNLNILIMNKALTLSLLLFISSGAIAQVIGKVDKKTKEFSIAPDQKVSYSIIGYQLPSTATKHMICFSSNENMVREESGKCLLGSYFDTEKIKVGDKIIFLGNYGKVFYKMSYVSRAGAKMVFYIPTTGIVLK